MTDEYLRIGEVAAIFRVDSKTAGRWCAQGKLPGAIRTPGGHWRVPRAAVDKLLRKEP